MKQVEVYDPGNPATFGEHPQNPSILYKNKMERESFNLANDLQTIADDYYNFYSVGRAGAEITVMLEAGFLDMELADKVVWDGKNWFVSGLTMNYKAGTMQIGLVELV